MLPFTSPKKWKSTFETFWGSFIGAPCLEYYEEQEHGPQCVIMERTHPCNHLPGQEREYSHHAGRPVGWDSPFLLKDNHSPDVWHHRFVFCFCFFNFMCIYELYLCCWVQLYFPCFISFRCINTYFCLDEHLGCFWFLAISESATVSFLVHIFGGCAWIFFG